MTYIHFFINASDDMEGSYQDCHQWGKSHTKRMFLSFFSDNGFIYIYINKLICIQFSSVLFWMAMLNAMMLVYNYHKDSHRMIQENYESRLTARQAIISWELYYMWYFALQRRFFFLHFFRFRTSCSKLLFSLFL